MFISLQNILSRLSESMHMIVLQMLVFSYSANMELHMETVLLEY